MSDRFDFLEGEEIYSTVVLKGLLGAKEKVRLATANLKNLHADTGGKRYTSAASFLFKLAKEGVTVEILHGAVPSGPLLAELREAWPPPEDRLVLKLCPRVHFKALIVDYSRLYMGSANFTGAGMGGKSARRRNFEVGLWTESPEFLDRVNMLFDRIWFGEECGNCGRKAHCPVPLEVFAP